MLCAAVGRFSDKAEADHLREGESAWPTRLACLGEGCGEGWGEESHLVLVACLFIMLIGCGYVIRKVNDSRCDFRVKGNF